MIKLPIQNQWQQPNNSDKLGSISFSKNINLDEEGYVKLSNRTFQSYDVNPNGNFDRLFGVSKISASTYLSAHGTGKAFNGSVSAIDNTWTENDGTSNPTVTVFSDAVWFQNAWHVSTDTAVLSRPATGGESQIWTSRITGLTGSTLHHLSVFEDDQTLVVTNGNVAKQYNTSYSNTTDLTIPSDYTICGIAYNNGNMGIITRFATNGTSAQTGGAQFFLWNGTTTGAQNAVNLNSDSGVDVAPYKDSFAVLTRTGELLYWNGGGFTRLAAFPFYYKPQTWGDPFVVSRIDSWNMHVDGDLIYINTGTKLNSFGEHDEGYQTDLPSGVWCYDPAAGLYHRYTPSLSQGYVLTVTSANVNTSTDVLTVSAGAPSQTIPATGNPVRLTSTTGIGGLTKYKVYYLINLTSTTFQVAETYEKAMAGEYIDLTSATAGTNYFWMYDMSDYGQSFIDRSFEIGTAADVNQVTNNLVIGSDLQQVADLDKDAVVSFPVQGLENRGYFVTPKIFPSQVQDSFQKLVVKYRPLQTDDKIIIKSKENDLLGLPISSTGTTGATWLAQNIISVTMDLSEAKTALDGNYELELEVISGSGAGTMVQVESINTDDNLTYSITLKEDVRYASAGELCQFVIDAWKVQGEINADNSDNGYKNVTIEGINSKWVQFKIELRGNETTIEELQIVNSNYELAA